MKLLTLLSTTTLLLLTPLTLAAPLDTATSDLTPTGSTPTTTTTTTTSTDQGSSSSSTSEEQGQEEGGSGNKPAAIQAVNYGAPRCKSAALEDLCISGNAGAYCDGTGFHCNFMASCKGVCWCE